MDSAASIIFLKTQLQDSCVDKVGQDPQAGFSTSIFPTTEGAGHEDCWCKLGADEQIKMVMLKAWPLWTSSESNLKDRILGEIEKSSFIALPGKGDTEVSCPEKLYALTLEDLLRSFTAMVQGGWGACGCWQD